MRAAKLWGKRQRFCGASTTAQDPMDHTGLRASKFGALQPVKLLQRVRRLLGTGNGGVRETCPQWHDDASSNFPCYQAPPGIGR